MDEQKINVKNDTKNRDTLSFLPPEKSRKNLKKLGLNENALTVLNRRYLIKDDKGHVVESPEELFFRVAKALASADTKYSSKAFVKGLESDFYNMMTELKFLPNSPTLMNAGRPLGQLSACFVLPVEDSMESIFETLKQTAVIHKSGGGTGFSFSRLRPKNDIVRSTKGISSGPVSFMKVFDAATEAVKQGGTRRGANMGILRVDHPDIMDFIECKKEDKQISNFNISIAITEKFMQAVEKGEDYDLINPRSKEKISTLNASKVFNQIVDLAWKNGEPGIIFIDRINKDNPTPHVGAIESTNPCGEQPLLPYESCNLGSINLGKFVKENEVDYDELERVVKLAVRFLDNVIEVNRYPISQVQEMTTANRKIGLGVMGFADMLIKLGISYDSEEGIFTAERIMSFIDQKSKEASSVIAKEKGNFPNFKGSIYDAHEGLEMRNATTTTIAPTGTISILADCSSGVEPLFGVAFTRNVMDKDKLLSVNPLFEQIAKENGFYSRELMEDIAEKGSLKHVSGIPEKYKKIFVTAHDVSPEYHMRMQAAFQKFTDNAVSKTVNFSNSATRDEVKEVYELAYKLGCKGVTIYRDGSRDEQVLTTTKSSSTEKPISVNKAEKDKRLRPKALVGKSIQMQTGCGPLYVTVNEDDNGIFELFNNIGKAGGCAGAQSEAIGRLVSLALRSGVSADSIIKQLIGISCHRPNGFGENKITSCADGIAKALSLYLQENGDTEIKHKISEEIISRGACPECGGVIEHEGGCVVCRACAFSECG